MYSLVCDHVTDLHAIRPTKVTTFPSLRPADPSVSSGWLPPLHTISVISATDSLGYFYLSTAAACLLQFVYSPLSSLPPSLLPILIPHCVCLLNIESSLGSYTARNESQLEVDECQPRKPPKVKKLILVTRCHLLSLPPPHQTHVVVTAPHLVGAFTGTFACFRYRQCPLQALWWTRSAVDQSTLFYRDMVSLGLCGRPLESHSVLKLNVSARVCWRAV